MSNGFAQVKEREAELEQCYMRMEKGEAPNDDIEKEWMKKLRDQARKRQEKEAALLVSVRCTLCGHIFGRASHSNVRLSLQENDWPPDPL